MSDTETDTTSFIDRDASPTEFRQSLRPHSNLKGRSDAEPPICDYCGGYIRQEPYKCPALPDGWCRP